MTIQELLCQLFNVPEGLQNQEVFFKIRGTGEDIETNIDSVYFYRRDARSVTMLVNDPVLYNPTLKDLPKIKIVEDEKKPDHYADMKVDVIDFCRTNNLDFLQGNVIKYVCRYKKKGGIDDLKKAAVYIDRMIKGETCNVK